MRNVIVYCLIVVCGILGLGSKFAVATPLPIVATTCEVTDVTSNSATLHGKITSSAGEQLVTVWFKYGTARDNYTRPYPSVIFFTERGEVG